MRRFSIKSAARLREKNLAKFPRLFFGVAIGVFFDHLAEIPAEHRLGDGVAVGRLLFRSEPMPFSEELVRDRGYTRARGPASFPQRCPTDPERSLAGAFGLQMRRTAFGQDLHIAQATSNTSGSGIVSSLKCAGPLGVAKPRAKPFAKGR